MTNSRKILRRVFLIVIIIIPVSAFAHFILFPQKTRSILIPYSNFKKEGSLYFNSTTPQNKIDSIQSLIESANNRVAMFWGGKKSNPTFIYCEYAEDFKKYGTPYLAPAVTHIVFNSFIVLSKEGAELDIIAHELSHAELYKQLGFYNWTFKIPRWFDEGLAMQNDYRNYYSEDTLKVKSDNFRMLPDVKNLKTGKQFSEDGTREQIMLNYMTAKHEIKNWYNREKLDKFIKDINAGKSFEEAFGQ